jgi:hypothetical protein
MMFYLSVPVIVWLLRCIGLWQGLLLLYMSSAAYSHILGELAEELGGMFVDLQWQLPGQLMYFASVGALYYFFGQFRARANRLLALGVFAVSPWAGFALASMLTLTLAFVYGEAGAQARSALCAGKSWIGAA